MLGLVEQPVFPIAGNRRQRIESSKSARAAEKFQGSPSQALSETLSYKKEHGEELRGVVSQWGLRACRALASSGLNPQYHRRKKGKEVVVMGTLRL